MRVALLTSVGLLLLAAGVAVGWFASPRPQSPASPVRYVAGDPSPLDPPPPWEHWQYPGSRVFRRDSGGGSTQGDIEFAPTDQVTLLTPDDFETVWAFYRERGELRPAGSGTTTHRFEALGSERGVVVKLFDDRHAHTLAGPPSDVVTARGFSVQSLRCSLTGFVLRAKGESDTRIHLVYRPLTEVIGLLREKVGG